MRWAPKINLKKLWALKVISWAFKDVYIWSVCKAECFGLCAFANLQVPLGQAWVDTSESRVKWSRRDVQSDGLLLSSDNRFNQYKCFRDRVIYYSIW